jgi:hypothetical protein
MMMDTRFLVAVRDMYAEADQTLGGRPHQVTRLDDAICAEIVYDFPAGIDADEWDRRHRAAERWLESRNL